MRAVPQAAARTCSSAAPPCRAGRRRGRARAAEADVESPTEQWLLSAETQARLGACSSAAEALLAASAAAPPTAAGARPLLSPRAAAALLSSLVELRRAAVALELLELLREAPRASAPLAWAPLGAEGVAELACSLAAARLLPEALRCVRGLAWGAGAEAAAQGPLSFGLVVRCPHCAARGGEEALALVPPGEGLQEAACAACGFEFQLLSGTVQAASSRALTGGDAAGGPLAPLLRALSPRADGGAGALHELLLAPPPAAQLAPRALRVATEAADVPAAVGQRVTVVGAAGAADARGLRRRSALGRALLPPRPPGTQPGQWLELSNHGSGAVARLVPPPAPGAEGAGGGGIAPLLPLLALAAAADGASGLLDPALPALLLAAAGAAAAAAAGARSRLLPALRRLPASALALEAARARLLRQHALLWRQAGALSAAAAEDCGSLARLAALGAKMQAAAGGGEGGLYGARRGRVAAAAAGLRARLRARLELLERTSRVASMVEIELELEGEGGSRASAAALRTLAPGGEGPQELAEEAAALREAELLQEEWRGAAEAADDVERLLRAVD